MRSVRAGFGLLVLAAAGAAGAQQPTAPAPQEPAAPRGTVIFERHGDSPEPDSDRRPLTADAPVPEVSDAERSAVRFTRYDLDAHAVLATADLTVRARIHIENTSPTELRVLPLQISSTLNWDSATLLGHDGKREPLTVAHHRLETDLDHTGWANEAVLTLPHPLVPGGTLDLEVLYEGKVSRDASRLLRIGAGDAQAAATDWDRIGPDALALRGFGNVLWYPVSAPAMFLGEGNRLFASIGRSRLAGESTSTRLRLTVEFSGEAPRAAFFRGERADLRAISNNATDDEARTGGIAVAEWPEHTAGFRTLDAFIWPGAQTTLASTGAAASSSSSSSSSAAEGGTPIAESIAAEEGVLPRLGAEVRGALPLLEEWFGPDPLRPLVIAEQHAQPFEDGQLLVAPTGTLAVSGSGPMLAHSLTHAFVAAEDPWISEGLAQFMALLSTERAQGRDAALAAKDALLQPLAIGEPAIASAADTPAGQPLIAATEEVFYRRKAAAVWWMLREYAGEAALKSALASLRTGLPGKSPTERAEAFEHALEAASHKDLAWFFADWVLRDRGLPDLVLADVTPRPLPAGKGHDTGWLVAITVRNDGPAVADVPLTISAGTFTTSKRLRIAGFSSVTERIFTEAAPTEVVLNDGSVPELRANVHRLTLNLTTK